MSVLDLINKNKLPQHIAIIMDGNGRWAKQQSLDRVMGHKEGVSAVRRIIEAATKIGVPYLTLYTFSTENWHRPEEEVKALMSLMIQAVVRETPDLIKNDVRIKTIGDLDRLPEDTRKALEQCMEDTSHCTKLTAVLALSYSSKWEITRAMKNIVSDIKAGKIKEEDIKEELIDEYLTTKDIPDPDILIRTGGEKRISNFLLWQIAYSELYFTDQLWPDFNEDSLYQSIVDYQNRERRFGKTSEQVLNEQ
ncbi:isoprenyl transferase [Dysgonomonas sp. ZJ709]|uniref:isoprenyl transferase n=1 Tax=Dysgonomonas sp. ZJ709 TaxID=2709797 RepID=UPI0013EB4252|nr:isoprenyl transferase [Dysgonomonas sp. ZJ709]